MQESSKGEKVACDEEKGEGGKGGKEIHLFPRILHFPTEKEEGGKRGVKVFHRWGAGKGKRGTVERESPANCTPVIEYTTFSVHEGEGRTRLKGKKKGGKRKDHLCWVRTKKGEKKKNYVRPATGRETSGIFLVF